MSRIFAIARLQTAGRRDGLLWPLVILSISFVVNLAIFTAAGDAFGEWPITGGVASIYIAALAFGAVAISQQFSFALGMSVTRREFSAAIGLFIVAQSLLYGLLLVILQAVENATDGWGVRLRFFGVGLLDDYGVLTQLAIYAVPMLLMSLIGIALGAVFVRWKVNGVFTMTASLGLVLGGAATLITKFGSWPAVGHWFTDQSALSLFAGWPLLLILLLAASSWNTLRRATG